VLALLVAVLLAGGADGDVVRVGGQIPKPERTAYENPVRSLPKLTPIGIVILELTLDEDGGVADVTFVRGAGLRDSIDLDVVKRWRYRPTVVGGRPARLSLRELIELFPTPEERALFWAYGVQNRKESKGYRLFAIEQLKAAPSAAPDVVKALKKAASDSDSEIATAASKLLQQVP
jgi:hypothetical protein